MVEKPWKVCEVPDCDASLSKGDALFRTSPKGSPFRGRCRAHMTAQIDDEVSDITSIIERGDVD